MLISAIRQQIAQKGYYINEILTKVIAKWTSGKIPPNSNVTHHVLMVVTAAAAGGAL